MSKSKSPQGPSEQNRDSDTPSDITAPGPQSDSPASAAATPPAEPADVAAESEASQKASQPNEGSAEPTPEAASMPPVEDGPVTSSETNNAAAREPAELGSNRRSPSTTKEASGPSTSATKRGPGVGRTVAISATVAILVSAGMIAAAGYYGVNRQAQSQQQVQSQLAAFSESKQQQQQTLTEMQRALEQQRAQLQQATDAQLKQMRQQLQQQVQSLAQQQDSTINRLQERVDAHQERLLSLSTTSREDWLLAEAEYLLKLANQRVLLERLPSNAIALLEAADLIIKQVAGGMGDAELFAVRRALAEELAALKSIDPVDKEGIYLKLHSLADMVDNLPRVPGHSFDQSARPVPTADEEPAQAADPEAGGLARMESWVLRAWDEVKGMAGMLGDYIKIEDADAPAKPLVDQYTSQVAGLNVRLLLEQAQVALLKEQTLAYQQSLEQAQVLIGKYYIESGPARELSESLAQLAAVDIAPQLPDISESLKVLNGYIRQLHKLRPAAEGQL